MMKFDSAIRNDIIQSAINIMSQRLSIENNRTLENMEKIMNALTVSEFIISSKDFISNILRAKVIEEYLTNVCMSWGKVAKME